MRRVPHPVSTVRLAPTFSLSLDPELTPRAKVPQSVDQDKCIALRERPLADVVLIVLLVTVRALAAREAFRPGFALPYSLLVST